MAYEVTIGIPVYNVEKFIRETLKSALAQSFESIEFLVLDDCGTDSSMTIVRELQTSHPRGCDIRVITQPHNMGIGHGRNRIIDEASGRYLFFLDADDFLPPHAIKQLYSAARTYQAQIVYGSHERIEEYGVRHRIIKNTNEFMLFVKADDFANYAFEKYGNISANVWKYLIDINIYRKNNLRFPIINFWEDFYMTIDLPTYIQRAVFIPDVTYHYYSRYGTLSNNQQRDNIGKQEVLDIVHAIGYLKENGARIAKKNYFLKRTLKVMMTEFYMVCYILKHHDVICPSFNAYELHDMIQSPLRLNDVLGFSSWKLKNLCFYLLGIFPSTLSVMVIKIVGKMKHLI